MHRLTPLAESPLPPRSSKSDSVEHQTLDEDTPPLSMHNFSDDSECLEESDSDSLDEHRPHQRIRGVGEEEDEEEIENEEEEGEEAGEVVSAIELGTRKPLRWGRPEDADNFDDPMEGDDHDYGHDWEEEKEPENATSKTEM
ncbi:hypothetical protein QFC24_004787 [Naganishia onofrii]|uniref:Uncharacterized protein n=1 Tax=Naganishia onofrii TaxID=1851511 RepID=A0ACC2XBN9_9TREE|nr:hypothetical protein QFC24_004787 [Naganishia onofrii]